MKHVAKKHRHCLTGVMASFTTNAHLDIDGLVIRQGKKKILFHFPPHTAKRVMQCAGLQAEVSVQYQEKAHLPKGPNTRQVKRELLTITQMANQAVVHINNIPPPDAVETRQVSTFTIERPVFSKGKQGELTGIGDQDRFFTCCQKKQQPYDGSCLPRCPSG